MLLLLHIVVMAFTAAAAWWLSGYDTKVTGEDKHRDLLRRGLRCGITLLLVDVAFTGLLRWLLYRDMTSGYIYILIALPLGLTWTGCLSESFARGFQRLVFPEDQKEADLGENRRSLDQLALLVREGRKEEAILLCQQLRESGSASDLALETLLSRLGVEASAATGARAEKAKPLEEADRLRAQGHATEAEAKLLSVLKTEPSNQAAALMLMRLYAEQLGRPDQAQAVLQAIAKERFIPPAFIEYAQRSIAEWSQPCAQAQGSEVMAQSTQALLAAAGPASSSASRGGDSVDELLAKGYLGSAIELLEQALKERPNDFELWMKLAEAQGVFCGNLSRAGKIVERLETNPAFTPEQVRQAWGKLKAWKAGPTSH